MSQLNPTSPPMSNSSKQSKLKLTQRIEHKHTIFKKTILDKPYVKPNPKSSSHWPCPQTVALLQNKLEVLYGGTCDDNKFDWLLMTTLQYVNK
ncbi:MAG: hypothetical protein LBH79_06065 [Nitrososphaerota archaeon]|jgi:hypothetical protein|nr:hypothetical protein [Nitrososphaerota archaeon]